MHTCRLVLIPRSWPTPTELNHTANHQEAESRLGEQRQSRVWQLNISHIISFFFSFWQWMFRAKSCYKSHSLMLTVLSCPEILILLYVQYLVMCRLLLMSLSKSEFRGLLFLVLKISCSASPRCQHSLRGLRHMVCIHYPLPPHPHPHHLIIFIQSSNKCKLLFHILYMLPDLAVLH